MKYIEERVHPKYFVATYGGDGFITHASAYNKEELEEKLKNLLVEGKIYPGKFVILKPLEGVSAKIDATVEINFEDD